MKQTVDIIGDVVESMEMTGNISAKTDNADGTFTLSVDNTYWVRPAVQGSPITTIEIGGTDYQVKSVVYCQSITIQADAEPTGDTFTLAAPKYFHGTPKAIGNERNKAQFTKDKCPAIWLAEPYRDNEVIEPRSAIAKRPDVVIFFLDQANYADWKTTEHYSNVITPMEAMKIEFFKKLNHMKNVFDYDRITSTVIRHAKFGAEGSGGHVQSIFDEKLSGIEVRMNLPIWKDLRCTNCNN